MLCALYRHLYTIFAQSSQLPLAVWSQHMWWFMLSGCHFSTCVLHFLAVTCQSGLEGWILVSFCIDFLSAFELCLVGLTVAMLSITACAKPPTYPSTAVQECVQDKREHQTHQINLKYIPKEQNRALTIIIIVRCNQCHETLLIIVVLIR